MGLFLLTGSQQFGLLSGVTQSLAGRTAFVELLPFSIPELEQAGVRPASLDEMLFTGGYPPLYDRGLRPRDWLSAYVMAYVERDVRQLLKVQDLEIFQRFASVVRGAQRPNPALDVTGHGLWRHPSHGEGMDFGAGGKLYRVSVAPTPCQFQQAADQGAEALLL